MEGIEKFHLLVVGGSGFIGSHVLQEGVRLGWHVDSLGLNEPSVARRVLGASYIVADITLPDTLSEVGKTKYDYVINLGGYIEHTPFYSGGRRQINTHFEGLINLIECLDRTRLRRFVHIGSSDEYGAAAAPQLEDSREQPISPYSLAKVAGTHFLQMLYRTEAFPAVILRLFLTYGPNQDNKRFLPQIINGCLQNQTFPTSNGEQLRDFCYVDDTVHAIYRVFECNDANGHVLNVGSGLPVSIKDIIRRVCEITGKGHPEFGKVDYRPGENMSLYADIRKIKKITGWRPMVSLEEGLALAIKWISNAS